MSGRAFSYVSLWMAMIVTCVAPPRARAEPELMLAWPTVEGCPDAATVVQHVEAQLSRPLRDVAQGVRASAAIVANESGMRLTLRTARGAERGERTLTGASCGEVSAAAALVLALSLGAIAEPTDAAPLTQPPRRRVGFRVRAGALGEVGFLPRVSGGAELGAALALARSRFEIAGVLLPAVRSERAADGARVSVWMWTARAGYCHDLVGRRTRLLGCAGLELGRAYGSGLSLARELERAYRWSAAQLALRLESRLAPHFDLYLEPSLALPFERRRFVSSDADLERRAVLHEPAPVSGRLSLGAQLAF